MTYSNNSWAVCFSTGSSEARPVRLGAGLAASALAVVSPSVSSGSGVAAAFETYSMRNGGSRRPLSCVYFEAICRYSGVEASVQLIQRTAPWESVKLNDQVWC